MSSMMTSVSPPSIPAIPNPMTHHFRENQTGALKGG
jgi:hypothetical protein